MAKTPLALLASLLLLGCPADDPPPKARSFDKTLKDPEPPGDPDGPEQFEGVLRVEDGEMWLERADGTRATLAGVEDPGYWKARRDRTVTVTGRVDVETNASEMVVAVEGKPRTHPADPGAFAPVRDESGLLGKAGGGKRFVLTPMEGPLGPGHPVTVGFISVDGDKVVAAVIDDGRARRHALEPGWALFKPIGAVVVNADDDIDLELVLMADWVKDASPGATVIQRHNVVMDYTGDELRQLPDVEAALVDAQTPAEIRRTLRDLRAALRAPADGDAAPPDGADDAAGGADDGAEEATDG